MSNKTFYTFAVSGGLELCAVIGYTSTSKYHVFLRNRNNPNVMYQIIDDNTDLDAPRVNALVSYTNATSFASDDKAIELIKQKVKELI